MSSNCRLAVAAAAASLLLLAAGCAAPAETPGARHFAASARPAPLASPAVRYSNVRAEDLIPPAPGEYRVRPGDVLELRVADLFVPGLETVRRCRVGDAGTINLPLVGALRVVGLTEAEINRAIDDAYRRSNI